MQKYAASTRATIYRLHKKSGRAVVTIEGRDIYLGTFGSPESLRKYGQLLSGQTAAPPKQNAVEQEESELPLIEVLAAYWSFAKDYYVKNGIVHLRFGFRKCGQEPFAAMQFSRHANLPALFCRR